MDKSKITWVIHNQILRNASEHLPDEVRAQGFNCISLDFNVGGEPPVLSLGQDDCVIMYGAQEFIRKINPNGRYQPGNYGQTDRTTASVYMSNLPLEWFLNRRAVMTTWAQFKSRGSAWLFQFPHFNNKPSVDRLFVRPNSGFKTFAGQCVRSEDWDYDVETIDKLTSVMPETIILVAPPISIQGEFRFVIVDGKVVTGSEYRWDNKLDIRIDYPEECHAMAQQVAEHPWQVDTVYTCDVALTTEGPKVVELNGFCSAGLYACDVTKVVARVSEAAWKDWTGND